ncbi:MAG: YfdX family protein [Chthoniobacteraceae bacterium]
MKAYTIQTPNTKRNHRITSALALSLAGTFLFASVSSLTAEEAKTPKASAATKAEMKTEKAEMKVSKDGFTAMREIHDARLAIFNGEPKVCSELLAKASEALAKASKDESVAKVKEDMIPIDGSLALADSFVPTEEKAKHVAKANEHFQKGDSKKGIEELKLGEVDVNFSRVLISLGTTEKRLAAAEALAKEHKYYECNLALKAAEDAVVLDSVSLLEFPTAAGKAAKAAKKP